MHVGIYLTGMAPESGGGYTFQADILAALKAHVAASPHSFTLLCETESLRQHAGDLGLSPNTRSVALGDRGVMDGAWRALTYALPYARRAWPRAGRLQRAIGRLGVDLVWFVAGGAHEIPDAPYIATVWDVQHRTHPWLPEVGHGGTWESREAATGAFLQRAAFVITGTVAGRGELETYYRIPQARVRILPHPTPAFALDAAASTPELPARFGLKPPYLLYPAQFWPHKNHVNLLHALASLKSRHSLAPQVALVGSDKGNRAHVEETAARLGVSEQIVFTGFVSQAELVSLYRHAGALVYPSMSGPENLPPLEAFALGCPVAASDIPGASEQLSECARLFSPFDPDGIAQAIREVLTDAPLRQRLVARGRGRAAAWKGGHFVDGVLKIVDEFEPARRCWPSPAPPPA